MAPRMGKGKDETLGYIHAMLAELAGMAQAGRHDMLAYLIEMAQIEARDMLNGQRPSRLGEKQGDGAP